MIEPVPFLIALALSCSIQERICRGNLTKAVESSYITNFVTFLPLGTCTFAADNCGFTQETNDQFDWTRATSYTRSQDTGPSVDHTYGTSANGMLLTKFESHFY